jgi:hypothetical protein
MQTCEATNETIQRANGRQPSLRSWITPTGKKMLQKYVNKLPKSLLINEIEAI